MAKAQEQLNTLAALNGFQEVSFPKDVMVAVTLGKFEALNANTAAQPAPKQAPAPAL